MQEIATNGPSEIIATIEEFIDVSQGGVSGSIVVEGALALPFDEAIAQKPSRRNSQSSGFVMPPAINNGIKSLQKKINGKIPSELLFLAIGILVLFLIWTGVSMISGGLNNESEQYKIILEEVETEISIAHTMTNEGRKEEALATLEQAEAKAKDAFHNSTFQADSKLYLKKITEMKDNLSDTTRISGKSLADISGDMPEESLKGVFLFDEEIYAFGEKNLFRIIGDNVENIIPLKEEEVIVAGIPLEKKQQMVFLSERGAVVEVSKTESSYAKTEDQASWKKGSNIGFFDKNIYILSTENNEIYKYSRGNDIYSEPSAYNKGSDLSDALSISIDGSIFVLKENGVVLKLLRGIEQDFQIEDAPEGFSNVTQVYTQPDLDLLLFLDGTSKRIFIFQKNDNEAVFERQILIDVENEVLSGISFDVSANRLLVSGKQKIYEVPLTK